MNMLHHHCGAPTIPSNSKKGEKPPSGGTCGRGSRGPSAQGRKKKRTVTTIEGNRTVKRGCEVGLPESTKQNPGWKTLWGKEGLVMTKKGCYS